MIISDESAESLSHLVTRQLAEYMASSTPNSNPPELHNRTVAFYTELLEELGKSYLADSLNKEHMV